MLMTDDTMISAVITQKHATSQQRTGLTAGIIWSIGWKYLIVSV